MLKKKFNPHYNELNQPATYKTPRTIFKIVIDPNEQLSAVIADRMLRTVTIKDVKKKIHKFRKLNIEKSNLAKIESKMYDLFACESKQTKEKLLITGTTHQSIIKDSRAYRVRCCDDIHDEINELKDFWEPPADKTKMGRLNLANEPRFYASKFPDIAIEECKIVDDKKFLLTRYIATKKLNLINLSKSASSKRLQKYRLKAF